MKRNIGYIELIAILVIIIIAVRVQGYRATKTEIKPELTPLSKKFIEENSDYCYFVTDATIEALRKLHPEKSYEEEVINKIKPQENYLLQGNIKYLKEQLFNLDLSEEQIEEILPLCIPGPKYVPGEGLVFPNSTPIAYPTVIWPQFQPCD